MRSPYTEWIKQPVLLQVKVEDFRTTLRGIILGESKESLSFRIWKGRRNFIIQKSTVLAVEEDPALQSSSKKQTDALDAIDWQVPMAS
jgi:hypothetical protein